MIRIVHLNGEVEEFTRPVTASEVLINYPNHVLSKPSSQGTVVRRIVIVSSNMELKRGGIYFLIPASSVSENKKKPKPRSESLEKVVKIKTVSRQRSRRSVDGGDWRPRLESICEEQ